MKYSQIKLPLASDTDPHPSLMLNNYKISCGDCFTAYIAGQGWKQVSIELGNKPGLEGWYIPGYKDICPVGLFVKN